LTLPDRLGDRHLLVTGDNHGRLVFWDAGTLRPRFPPIKDAHKDGTSAVAIRPQGDFCVSGGRDGRLRLWGPDGKSLGELAGAPNPAAVNDVAVSPDGKLLAVARDASTVEVWDLERRKLVRSLEGMGKGKGGPRNQDIERVWVVTFAPSGELFASGVDGTVRRWDPGSGRAGPVVLRHQANAAGIRAAIGIAIGPGGKEIATTGMDNTIRRWESASGKLLWTLEGNTQGLPFSVLAAAFDPASRTLLTGGDHTNALLRRWDMSEQGALRDLGDLRELQVYDRDYPLVWGDPSCWPTALAIEPGGKRFAAALVSGDLLYYETASGKLLHREKKVHTFPGGPLTAGIPLKVAVMALAWSRDGKQLVSLGTDRKMKRWDTANYKLLNAWDDRDQNDRPAPPAPRTGLPFKVPEMPSFSLAFDPDNEHVLSGSNDGVLRRWDVKTGKLVARYPAHTRPLWTIAFSRDGKWLATGSNSEVLLWDWSKKQPAVRTALAPLLNGGRFGGFPARVSRLLVGEMPGPGERPGNRFRRRPGGDGGGAGRRDPHGPGHRLGGRVAPHRRSHSLPGAVLFHRLVLLHPAGRTNQRRQRRPGHPVGLPAQRRQGQALAVQPVVAGAGAGRPRGCRGHQQYWRFPLDLEEAAGRRDKPRPGFPGGACCR
jgi:WD40 repeat protein